MINEENAAILLIDIQEKLIPAIDRNQELISNIKKLIAGAQVLGLPIIWCEQIPEKIGPTLPEIAELMPQNSPIAKDTFSALEHPIVIQKLQEIDRNQIIVAGIEAHICVEQSACQLLEQGYEVHIAADCISSRTPANREIGLQKMLNAGAEITCVETALFEMLKVATGDKFKQILKIIK